MRMEIHELKTWPEYFDAVWTNKKNFEVRKNDRGYQIGDLLLLREYNPAPGLASGEYSGREILAIVRYLCQLPHQPDNVGMTIDVIRRDTIIGKVD